MLIRACGPVGKPSIAYEILTQVSGATKENCHKLAEEAIAECLEQGLIEKYDEYSYIIS